MIANLSTLESLQADYGHSATIRNNSRGLQRANRRRDSLEKKMDKAEPHSEERFDLAMKWWDANNKITEREEDGAERAKAKGNYGVIVDGDTDTDADEKPPRFNYGR